MMKKIDGNGSDVVEGL